MRRRQFYPAASPHAASQSPHRQNAPALLMVTEIPHYRADSGSRKSSPGIEYVQVRNLERSDFSRRWRSAKTQTPDISPYVQIRTSLVLRNKRLGNPNE